MITNDSPEGRALAVLLSRTKLALGSMSLVEKQLLELHTVLTELMENCIVGPQGVESQSSSESFDLSPDLSAYEGLVK